MIKIEIVPMTVAHIDDIMVVEKLSFTIPWSRNAFVEEITRNQFAVYLSARVGDRIVGYAGMWKVCDEGHITNIAVHPEFRGNGIGNALLETLVGIAEREGVIAMTLEVRRGNIIAQALYKKYGFIESGVRKGYYADNGEDAVIMWRNRIDG